MNGSSSNRAAPPQAAAGSAAEQAAAKKVVAGGAAKSLGLMGFFAMVNFRGQRNTSPTRGNVGGQRNKNPLGR